MVTRLSFFVLLFHLTGRGQANADEILSLINPQINAAQELVNNYDDTGDSILKIIDNYDEIRQKFLISLSSKIIESAQVLIKDDNNPQQILNHFLSIYGTIMQGSKDYIEKASEDVAKVAISSLANKPTWSNVANSETWLQSIRETVYVGASKISSTFGFGSRAYLNAISKANHEENKWYAAIAKAWKLDGPVFEKDKIEHYCNYAAEYKNFDGANSLCKQFEAAEQLRHTLKMNLIHAYAQYSQENDLSNIRESLKQMTIRHSLKDLAIVPIDRLQKTFLTQLQHNSAQWATAAIKQLKLENSHEIGLASYRLVSLYFLVFFNTDAFAENIKNTYESVSFNDQYFTLTADHLKVILHDKNDVPSPDSLKEMLIDFYQKHLPSNQDKIIIIK